MKKTVLILFIIFNLLLVAAIGGLLVLAETYPLHPGDGLYTVQHVAEQWRLRLTPSAEGQAKMSLELAERRLADLAQAEEVTQVSGATAAMDLALSEAARRIDPPSKVSCSTI